MIIPADTDPDLQSWASLQRNRIDDLLDSCGAILLRGFSVSGDADFKALPGTLWRQPLEYIYRSTPRTDLGDGVYTATEYPAGLEIPLHCENSYQRDWPLRLLFCCMQPAAGGRGQTPLADIGRVTRRIDAEIQKRFLDKQVMYIRNYSEHLDLPWQTVFQTQSPTEVADYCRRHDIDFEWTAAGGLRTRQVCPALVEHPRTGALVWFNQAHLFHPSALGDSSRQTLGEMFAEADFPRNATHGDGSPIRESDLAQIRESFKAETVRFEWRAGDVLILDNMRVAHGRTSYKGKRRVLAAMCSPFSSHKAR